jgi:hypothetical protein
LLKNAAEVTASRELISLMIGSTATSLIAGQVTSKTGRYKFWQAATTGLVVSGVEIGSRFGSGWTSPRFTCST